MVENHCFKSIKATSVGKLIRILSVFDTLKIDLRASRSLNRFETNWRVRWSRIFQKNRKTSDVLIVLKMST